MLNNRRFKEYFDVIGSFNEHFGEFKDCSNIDRKKGNNTSSVSSGSCC
jgi:hypothetical protein